jgi:hypothetical protein
MNSNIKCIISNLTCYSSVSDLIQKLKLGFEPKKQHLIQICLIKMLDKIHNIVSIKLLLLLFLKICTDLNFNYHLMPNMTFFITSNFFLLD